MSLKLYVKVKATKACFRMMDTINETAREETSKADW